MVAYCGWDPTEPITDKTVLLNGNGSPVLLLPALRVTDVSAVTVTYFDGQTWSPTEIGPGSPVGWTEAGELVNNYRYWPEGQQNVSVTFSGGYSGPTPDLAAALDKLSSRMPQLTGYTSAKLGSASFTFAANVATGGLLMVEQMVFDRYRLPKAA